MVTSSESAQGAVRAFGKKGRAGKEAQKEKS